MPIYGSAFELSFNRAAAGADIHPNQVRLQRSFAPWGDTGVILTSTFNRGYVPHPATGEYPVVRQFHGTSFATVGGPFSVHAVARDQFAMVDGLAVVSSDLAIQRAGYGRFIGRGRAAGGDYAAASGALRTALIGGGAATTLLSDSYAGPGYFDSELALGDEPWQTGLTGLLWQSHIGVFDFIDDGIDEDIRQDQVFTDLTTHGNSYTLPNGEVMKDCAYASMSPEGVIWILPADYGSNVPSDITQNTANAFRNHPSVFVRPSGSCYVRSVTRRWRDEIAIVTPGLGSQPIGIAEESNAVARSKWLIVVDGVASVVFIPHPDGTDYRRPKDIWNNVIVPLIWNHSGNVNRIETTDFFGNPVGTEVRWSYLSYARYLGSDAATVQDNAATPG